MRLYFFGTVIGCCIVLTGCMAFGNRELTPVIDAARSGDTGRLEQLLKAGADPNFPAGVNGWTPLMHAIHKNQAQSVSILLAHGALANQVRARTTPLIMAAGYGYTPIVRILIQAGADPHQKTADGTDALSAAIGGASDIDRFTTGHCQTETVRALLTAAPDLKIRTDSGALTIAKFAGCSEILQLMKGKKLS